ncbi:hypothetical protein SPRG_17878 [Saprolegnia parasitica CBS 223.65]|uniref:Asparagine synthetase domain-containing protein n=1 Tax=Saprolegnia parasitica (strain CBS 223.65) TaxID=695850 RepID=A0A067BIQ0_SAPPC|nr:hypothetical protein SPRG_17878 [Saprolegnia parasitica CBS 223.65]KDO16620.1 hypothetical protein SPRG_17878 [Saprolegnia parasitica CBS 223.65]|eukprot:XP_012212673.1 hypothetical protein SPRG_17878 [Saprolegnia parasitica CBS 223.65]
MHLASQRKASLGKMVLEHPIAPVTLGAYVRALSPDERRLARDEWHPLHTALCLEMRVHLPNYLRVPFLDHPLTSYVNSLPPNVRLRVVDGTLVDKWVLREATKPFISDELYRRPKKPFLAPPCDMADDDVHWRFLRDTITQGAVAQLGWMDWGFVAATLDRFRTTSDRQAYNCLNSVAS